MVKAVARFLDRVNRALGTGVIRKRVGNVLQQKTEAVRCFGTSIVVEEMGSTVTGKMGRLTGSRDKRTGRVGKSRCCEESKGVVLKKTLDVIEVKVACPENVLLVAMDELRE
ncbi:hypothetical protein Tco_1169756 [Tanacetum coccineum]